MGWGGGQAGKAFSLTGHEYWVKVLVKFLQKDINIKQENMILQHGSATEGHHQVYIMIGKNCYNVL
jgi:hypothetical protein